MAWSMTADTDRASGGGSTWSSSALTSGSGTFSFYTPSSLSVPSPAAISAPIAIAPGVPGVTIDPFGGGNNERGSSIIYLRDTPEWWVSAFEQTPNAPTEGLKTLGLLLLGLYLLK